MQKEQGIALSPKRLTEGKQSLSAAEMPKLDTKFVELTEGAALTKKEKFKTKWAAPEALVGIDKRLALVAEDLVKHWEARYAAMEAA
jgi:type I restriction enzyme R subunit